MNSLEEIALKVAKEIGIPEFQTMYVVTEQREIIEFARRLVAALGAQEPVDALDLAIVFHHTYESLAPSNGYDTRKETRVFNPDSANGRLMVATCAEVIRKFNLAAPVLPSVPEEVMLVKKFDLENALESYEGGDGQSCSRILRNILATAPSPQEDKT